MNLLLLIYLLTPLVNLAVESHIEEHHSLIEESHHHHKYVYSHDHHEDHEHEDDHQNEEHDHEIVNLDSEFMTQVIDSKISPKFLNNFYSSCEAYFHKDIDRSMAISFSLMYRPPPDKFQTLPLLI